MKTRVITGAVGCLILIGVLFLPPIALPCALSLICALAVFEMFHVTGLQTVPAMQVAAILFAVTAPFFRQTETPLLFCTAVILLVLALVFVQLRHHEDLPIAKTGLAFFLTILLSVGISCTVYCRTMNEYGLFYFILSLMIAWGTDTGAYFIGTFCGKHKLCPSISPKKTVEGLIGGWVFAVLASLLAAYIWQKCTGDAVQYLQVGLVAFVLSPFSVVGDLFASVIKRQSGAKDYGNIMPGHGGIMDRFDSLVFVAPLLFATVHLFTLFA